MVLLTFGGLLFLIIRMALTVINYMTLIMEAILNNPRVFFHIIHYNNDIQHHRFWDLMLDALHQANAKIAHLNKITSSFAPAIQNPIQAT